MSSACPVYPHTSPLFKDLQCFSVTFWIPFKLLSFGTQFLEPDCIPLRGTRDFAYGTKITDRKIGSLGDYLIRPNVINHMGL